MLPYSFLLPAVLRHYTIQGLLATLASRVWALKQAKETQQSLRLSSSCEWNSFAICPGRKQHFDPNEWQMATIRSERDYWKGVVYDTCVHACMFVCPFRMVCSDLSLKDLLQDLFLRPLNK